MSPFSKHDKFITLAGPAIMWVLGFATCYLLHSRGVL